MTNEVRWPGARIGLAALLCLLAACSNSEPEIDVALPTEPPEGMVPIGGGGRPRDFLQATEGASQVPLWRFSDQDTVVYVLGTVHFMLPKLDWKRPAIASAFARADAVFLEADVFSKPAQRAMGIVVTRSARLDEPERLRGFYDLKEQKLIDEGLRAVGASLDDFSGYRPWFAAMQAESLALRASGADLGSDPSVLIARETLQRGLALRYLETAPQQIASLAAGRDKADALYLKALVGNLAQGQVYWADLLGTWYQGDLRRLAYILHGPFEEAPERKRRVLGDHNNDWAQQIDRVLTDERGTFVVVVGAEHVVGELSVIAKLEARGYEPTPL